MAKYERIVTTKAGLELLENAAYMGSSIQFTVLKTGNGVYDGTEDLSTMTDLKNVCQTFGVGSVTKKEGNVIVRVAINNNDLTEEYTMTELGLYAADSVTGEEILYAVIKAESGHEDYVPPYTDAPASITFEAYMEITESEENVIFNVSPAEGVYVPVQSFEEHIKDKGHVTPEEKENWNNKQDALSIDDELNEESDNLVTNKAVTAGIKKKLDSTGNASNTTVAFSEVSELKAPTSGSKLSTLFGIVAKAISSLISHLADTVIHVTKDERAAWNDKANGTHTHSKSEVGLGNVDNTADSAKSVKHATSANAVIDYADANNPIQIGYRGTPLDSTTATHLAAYGDNGTKIKDITFSEVKKAIGLGSVNNTTDSEKSVKYAASAGIAEPKFNNGTLYDVGDDVAIGDQNVPGTLIVQGKNGDGAIEFRNPSGAKLGTAIHTGNIGSQSVNYANSAGSVAWGNVAGKPSTFPPTGHQHAPTDIAAGTFGGKVQANATAMATLTDAQVRDVLVATSVTEGGTSPYADGTIVFTKG